MPNIYGIQKNFKYLLSRVEILKKFLINDILFKALG